MNASAKAQSDFKKSLTATLKAFKALTACKYHQNVPSYDIIVRLFEKSGKEACALATSETSTDARAQKALVYVNTHPNLLGIAYTMQDVVDHFAAHGFALIAKNDRTNSLTFSKN